MYYFLHIINKVIIFYKSKYYNLNLITKSIYRCKG